MMLLPWHTEYFQLRPRCWLQGQRAQQLSRWCLGQSTELGSCSWRAARHSWSSSARRSWEPRLTRCPHCSHTSGLNCLPTCHQRLWSWISRQPMNIDLFQSNSQWQNTTRGQFGTVDKQNFSQYTIQYHILSLGVSFYCNFVWGNEGNITKFTSSQIYLNFIIANSQALVEQVSNL